jgi:hypothetical protein
MSVVTEISFLCDPRYRLKRYRPLTTHAAGVRRASGFVLVAQRLPTILEVRFGLLLDDAPP